MGRIVEAAGPRAGGSYSGIPGRENDYRKTYIASYKEASTTRLRIAEHLRKLPMSFFNTKDLSDITTNMMADCSSMESMLSSTIPPLIANIISVTLTCVCLAFFDWRMALAIFCTMPVTFLIIWCGRKLQLRLFDKQVDVKLERLARFRNTWKVLRSSNLVVLAVPALMRWIKHSRP